MSRCGMCHWEHPQIKGKGEHMKVHQDHLIVHHSGGEPRFPDIWYKYFPREEEE